MKPPTTWMSRFRGRRRALSRNYRYVFVVTYGRSGSTLVQGLLNTLPRSLVRGENNFYILPLYRSLALVRSFKKKHAKHGPAKTSSAFYGLNEIDAADFVRSTRDLVTRQLLGSRHPGSIDVLGFKEVLWHRITPKETSGFFDFLDRCFPGALYVLNQRDHERVVGSGFWQKQEQDEVMRAITRVEEIQQYLRDTRPDRVFDTRYEELTSGEPEVVDGQLRGLAEFVLGSCEDGLLAAMRDTLKEGHGPNPFGVSRGRKGAASR